ncbi:MAG: hypothetical protein M1530_02745 [Candidatus Marsarchaeota archaeon]|nr:hypothetical protein [Candidatus Marsarchaeota archaeon]
MNDGVIDLMNGKTRGQAAMEYLMTYGWALLVIVVVIAILLVINPLQPPQGCRFDQIGFTCSDPLVNSTGILFLKVTNGNSNNIILHAVNCTTDKSPTPPAYDKTKFDLNQPMQRQETWELNSTKLLGVQTSGIQCYDSTGGKLSPAAGSDFSGRLWVFYNNEEDGANYPIRSTSASVVAKVS